ncbi:MAG: hypothetical protein K0R26_719 [Bacteroidota bacterium]|jgi:hypothetical protein|nr:hypothetical protein [Bacteroidota bacterium]
MKENLLKKENFVFEHLPKYAKYLLENKLEEFVTVSIRFAREVDLPLLKPLARIPEPELVKLSVESNRLQLTALANNTVSDFIEMNLDNWAKNQLGVLSDGKAMLDKSDVIAEDLTLAFYIKRKTLSYFLYGYTTNPSVRQLIVNEADQYTSFEELASLKVYFNLQKDKLDGKN